MKLKTRLMMFTAVAALSGSMALAAINPQALADAYIREGYSYVEVKVGPTQTKLEAVKGTRKVEVIYDNASGQPVKQEFENAAADDLGRSGIEIENSRRDFLDDDDDDADEDDDADDDDDDRADDADDDDADDDDDDADDDDNDDDRDDDDDDDDDDEDDEEDGEDDGDDDDGDDD